MKYLFVVNSHITALSAKAVIAYEKLPHKDIVILTMRGASVKDTDLKHIEFLYPHIVNPIPQTRNIFKSWKVLKEFDRFIQTVTGGEKFYCYVNHNMARNTELMVNHRDCVGFSIMEEGATAYCSQEYFEKKYARRFPTIWDLLGYKNRIRRRYFYRPDYDKVYAVTSGAFPGFRDKVLLTEVLSSGNKEYGRFNNAHIIVFDAVVTFGLIDMTSFLAGLNKFISISFDKSGETVFYKFHPAQPKEEREQINSFLSGYKEIKFTQLADDIILEELVAVAANLVMYFNVSTISIYANALGHRCFSFSDILCELSKEYRKKIQNLNDTLKNSSVQIK